MRDRHVAMLGWVMVGGVLAGVGLAGCTAEPEKEEPPQATSKTVCGSVLDAPGRAALERISGTDDFRSPEDLGESTPFSIKLAAKNLHNDEPERCHVYKANDRTSRPVITVDFAVRAKYSKSDETPRDDPDAYVDYPIGLYAATKAESSAALLFRCATKGSQGSTPFIRASMVIIRDQAEVTSTSKDRMTILNSMSRRLTEELGCGDEAKLPTQLPDALPRA